MTEPKLAQKRLSFYYTRASELTNTHGVGRTREVPEAIQGGRMVGHGRPGGEMPCLHRLAATQLQLINAVEGEADSVLPRFPKQRTENNLDFYLKSLDL